MITLSDLLAATGGPGSWSDRGKDVRIVLFRFTHGPAGALSSRSRPNADGHDYIADACDSGATGVLCQHRWTRAPPASSCRTPVRRSGLGRAPFCETAGGGRSASPAAWGKRRPRRLSPRCSARCPGFRCFQESGQLQRPLRAAHRAGRAAPRAAHRGAGDGGGSPRRDRPPGPDRAAGHRGGDDRRAGAPGSFRLAGSHRPREGRPGRRAASLRPGGAQRRRSPRAGDGGTDKRPRHDLRDLRSRVTTYPPTHLP